MPATKRQTVESFPARLAELRERRGWTMLELAERAGTSLYSVSKMERAERAPSFALACRLADALGVKVDSLRQPAGIDATERTSGRPKKS